MLLEDKAGAPNRVYGSDEKGFRERNHPPFMLRLEEEHALDR